MLNIPTTATMDWRIAERLRAQKEQPCKSFSILALSKRRPMQMLHFYTTHKPHVYFVGNMNPFISRSETTHTNAGGSFPIRHFCNIPLNASA
jgi:hypothetical protein